MSAPETNERYTIRVEAPLLRPGITVETTVSSRYLVPTLRKILDKIREFNTPPELK